MNLRSLVLDYLHTLQTRGVQRLAVDEEARLVLREWMLAAKRGGRPAPVVPVPAARPAEPMGPQLMQQELLNWEFYITPGKADFTKIFIVMVRTRLFR